MVKTGKSDKKALKRSSGPLGQSPSHLMHRALQLALDIYAEEAGADGPTQRQFAVMEAVAAKEGVVSEWRGLSQKAHAAGAAPELKQTLATLTKKVEAADAKIREAAKPQKLHFEITPMP